MELQLRLTKLIERSTLKQIKKSTWENVKKGKEKFSEISPC